MTLDIEKSFAFMVLGGMTFLFFSKRASFSIPPLPAALDDDDNPRSLFQPFSKLHPDTFPLSARFLASAYTASEPLRYSLRGTSFASGLRFLPFKRWLEVDPSEPRLRRELMLKSRLLDPLGPFFSTVFAAGEGTLGAQREVLCMVLRALRLHTGYSLFVSKGGLWEGEGDGSSVERILVTATGAQYEVAGWSAFPLALACQLVQEDFIILQEGVFTAGAACFSFSEVGLRGERGNMRLGEPMAFIHAAVPGFATHMAEGLKRIFSGLKPGDEGGMYRANWGLAPNGTLSPFEAEIEDPSRPKHSFSRVEGEGVESGVVYSVSNSPISKLFLKVEHQTIHCLPSGAVLFTIRTYADPLPHIFSGGAAHGFVGSRAALVLADTINSLTTPQLLYRDLANEDFREKLIRFLKVEAYRSVREQA